MLISDLLLHNGMIGDQIAKKSDNRTRKTG